jgi:hypothetical protein
MSSFTKCYLRPGRHFRRLLPDWLIVDLLSTLLLSALACAACLAGCAIAGWRGDCQPKHGSTGGGSSKTFHLWQEVQVINHSFYHDQVFW